MENLGMGEWIVICLSALILLSFFVGNWINNQNSINALRWLKRGLVILGEVKSARLGAAGNTGIRLKIEMADGSPLNQILGNLALERRENLPLWLYQLQRGKHDRLTLMAEVNSTPAGEIHLYHHSNREPIEAARRGEKANIPLIKQSGEFSIYASSAAQTDQLERIETWAVGYPDLLLELALQHRSPQFILEARLAPLLRNDPQRFFQSLKNIL